MIKAHRVSDALFCLGYKRVTTQGRPTKTIKPKIAVVGDPTTVSYAKTKCQLL